MATRKVLKNKWTRGFAWIGLILLLLEVVLRLIHFRFEPDTEFAYPRPADFAQLRYDPDLFWTLPPSQTGINSWGFPGDEVLTPKPEGVYRMVFLGDSIMQAGYPAEVEICLHSRGITHVEAIPLAINGYSSFQGRVVAEKYGARLEPDLVLVQFGWNDHWLAYGEPDAEKSFPPPSSWQLAFHKVYDRVRILQGMGWLWGSMSGQGNRQTGEFRVPPAQYRENLTVLRTLFENQNIPVVFITTPSAHPQGGVPHEIIQRGFATDADGVLQWHRTYNDIVREVAGEGRLIDLEKAFGIISADDIQTLFQEDGIHPTRVGTRQIAQRVCEVIQKEISLRDSLETQTLKVF